MPFIWVPVLAAVLVSTNIYWMYIDFGYWPWDQAYYGRHTLGLYYSLISSPLSWPQEVVNVFHQKAPLIAWVGHFFVPLKEITHVKFSLLFPNVIYSFLSLLVIYQLVFNVTKSQLAGLVALLSLSAGPMFIGLPNELFVEPLQCLLVIVIFYILERMSSCNSPLQMTRLLVTLITFGFLGLAAKITTPLYVLFPALAVLSMLIYQGKWRLLIKGFRLYLTSSYGHFLLCLVVIALIVSWYVIHLDAVISFAKGASSGSNAELYASHTQFQAKLQHWLKFSESAYFGNTIARGLELFVLSVLLVALFFNNGFNRVTFLAIAFLVQVVFTILFFSTQINEETRYLLPLMPSMSVFIALSFYSIRGFKVPVLLVSALVFLGATGFHRFANVGLYKEAHWIPWIKDIRDDRGYIERTRFIIGETCHSPEDSGPTMLGVNQFHLNYQSVLFYRDWDMKKWQEGCKYSVIGMNNDINFHLKKFERLQPEYFITYKQDVLDSMQKDPWNQAVDKVGRLIGNQTNWGVVASEFDINVFRRDGDWRKLRVVTE